METGSPTTRRLFHSTLSGKRSHLDQSSKMPSWLWKFLAKSLGIKTSPTDTPLMGTILYVTMLTSCLAFGASAAYVIAFDVMSDNTKSTFFTVSYDILVGSFWCCIGPYANNLVYTILSSHVLRDCIRLHARTVLKVNSGLLIALLMLAMLVVYLFGRVTDCLQPNLCATVGLPPWLCYFSYANQVVYSFLACFSNLVVFSFVMSINRTHTIVLRRFTRELELDGRVMAKVYRLQSLEAGGMSNRNLWHAGDSSDLFHSHPVRDFEGGDAENNDQTEKRVSSRGRTSRSSTSALEEPGPESGEELPEVVHFPPTPTPSPSWSAQSIHLDPEVIPCGLVTTTTAGADKCSVEKAFKLLEMRSATAEEFARLALTNADLYSRYSALQTSMTIFSHVFQRWVVSWLSFICLWTIRYILKWLHAKPDWFAIVLFVIPFILFALLCWGYGEVNNESLTVSKAIYPTDERMRILRLTNVQPLQVCVFNTPLTYATIMTILLALGVAFTSRIIMDELK